MKVAKNWLRPIWCMFKYNQSKLILKSVGPELRMFIFRPNNKLITLIQDTRPNEYLLTPEAFMHVLWHKD